jgi:Icc-related predicted phosphoesterase
MNTCYFASDLHGLVPRYRRLFETIRSAPPAVVFLGGDLMPHGMIGRSYDRGFPGDFVNDFLVPEFDSLRKILGQAYPQVYVLLGNDDGRLPEPEFQAAESSGIWRYIPNHKIHWGDFLVFGYGYVPPTPFLLKDWERYDVSRYVDPGCVSPEEGYYSVPVPDRLKRHATIQKDLEKLTEKESLERAIFLFHTPPYQTLLDRMLPDPPDFEHVPLDRHAGSIAVKRFIETRQPWITLHGHIHESARLTGAWGERIGRTFAFSAAHDGPELSLIRFTLEHPEEATRELINV